MTRRSSCAWSCVLAASIALLHSGVRAGEVANPPATPAAEPESSADAIAESAEGLTIASITLDKRNIFDLSDPRENNALFRLANRWHFVTRDPVILRQLLLAPGDRYSQQLAEESERILRSNQYFYNASIEPQPREDGSVDLKVSTREVWTLKPQLSLSRSGGENKTTVGVEEVNLLGLGQSLTFERTKDVDRTSSLFIFSDRHFVRNWLWTNVSLSNNSDGHSRFLSVAQPFYALDTRHSGGITVLDDERRTTLYDLGDEVAEYRHEQQFMSLFGGWSPGRDDGWVRRYTVGAVYDENRFSEVPNGSLAAAVPEDRKLVYPFIGFEILEDRFETARNRDKIDRTEDFYTGTRFSARLGVATPGLGSDRDALVYSGRLDHSWGAIESQALFLTATASGRVENGGPENARLSVDWRYFNQQSEKRLFFATANTIVGWDLDLDNLVELGGDTGLRGYPLRYQLGESRALLTLEQRYFTDWYLFRLVRVGGAIFADAGRTWGDNPVGGPPSGWLTDVGFGLRFAPTRTGFGKIVHLDIAFPLDGDESIDSVQVLVTAKKSF